MKTRIGKGHSVVITYDQIEHYVICCEIQLHEQERTDMRRNAFRSPGTIALSLCLKNIRHETGFAKISISKIN